MPHFDSKFEQDLLKAKTRKEFLDLMKTKYPGNGPYPMTPQALEAAMRLGGGQGQYGWAYYSLNYSAETVASGATKVVDLSTDINSTYTETSFWVGDTKPDVNPPAGETFGPILKNRYDYLMVQLSIGLDLGGVAVPVGIKAGIYKSVAGFYWVDTVHTLDTGELTFFQGGRAGNRITTNFMVTPYWLQATTPGNYEDLLEGFGIGITNLSSVSIDLQGGHIAISGY